jgi:hypothetical protein
LVNLDRIPELVSRLVLFPEAPPPILESEELTYSTGTEAVPVTTSPVTCLALRKLAEPSSLWLGIPVFMWFMVSVAATEYTPLPGAAPFLLIVYARIVPSCCATYSRPSGPKSRDVGFTRFSPVRPLALKLCALTAANGNKIIRILSIR